MCAFWGAYHILFDGGRRAALIKSRLRTSIVRST